MEFEKFKAIIVARQKELKAKQLKSNITDAQWVMLKCLFDRGSSFPRDWVPREELHNLVNQSDYRRRLTELGDEFGVHIERQSGTNSYRLSSMTLRPANPRSYLSATQKKALFIHDRYCCRICGRVDLENAEKSLQADHKIPLAHGGTHSSENWQTLCYNCNVGKRRACENCTNDCKECVWAFPEIHGIRIICSLTPQKLQSIINVGIKKENISAWILSLIEAELGK